MINFCKQYCLCDNVYSYLIFVLYFTVSWSKGWLCVITRKWIKIRLMAKKANDCGCDNLFIFYPVTEVLTRVLTRPLQHHSRASPSWSRFSIDWLPACFIVDRKIVPATQLKAKWRTFFAIADTCSMAVLGGRVGISRNAGTLWAKRRETREVSRSHFEAWELDSGEKVTGRIKMAEGSVRS